jgi:hypothetical protein
MGVGVPPFRTTKRAMKPSNVAGLGGSMLVMPSTSFDVAASANT